MICAFDAYGTLFDVAAAARILGEKKIHDSFTKNWQKLAEIWRTKQLQYTWLRTITNDHADFWTVTQDGLDYALKSLDLENVAGLRQQLLKLYWELKSYPEVPEVLINLRNKGYKTAILSNGSPEMLNAAVASASIEKHLDAVLSVETVGVFKPHQKVYEIITDTFHCHKDEVLFISANGWDVAAAGGHGFKTIWVNRMGEPIDELARKPQYIIKDLKEVPALAEI